MKRFLPILLILLTLLPADAHRPSLGLERNPVLRLHILANSDSEEDQRVKLLVRDAIRPLFEQSASYADARTFLLTHGALLQSTAQSVLDEYGVNYGVQLSLGTESFPDRVYGQALFPAGEYEALIVRLGRGEGRNWWCVLFPPLCIISDDVDAVDLDKLEPESTLLEWIKEWMEQWKK